MKFNISKFFLIYIAPVISPTYLITNYFKNKEIKASNQNKRIKLKKLYNSYYYLSWLFFGLLFLWPDTAEKFPLIARIIFFLITYFAISRSLEIFIDFLRDSIDKMINKPVIKQGLTYTDRYILALKTYLELILDYGIIYYAFNTNYAHHLLHTGQNLFIKNFDSIFEAVYLSVNTITILGFGDIYPTHPLTQLISVFEVLTGVFILIVTFTIYVTLNFTDDNNLKSKKNKNSDPEKNYLIFKIQIIIILVIIIAKIINISIWLK
ncbi:MAG: ion channel [Bacillota bacterium]